MSEKIDPRVPTFMELPIPQEPVAAACLALRGLACDFRLVHDPGPMFKKIQAGVSVAPLVAKLIEERISGRQEVTADDVRPYITTVANFLPPKTGNRLHRLNNGDIASSIALGALWGVLHSEVATKRANDYLDKAEPYISLLTSSELGPRGQVEYEAATVLETMQYYARQSAAARQQEKGATAFVPADPDRYVRREDIADTLPFIISTLLEGHQQLPFLSAAVRQALSYSSLTDSQINDALTPKVLRATVWTLVTSLNALLPENERYKTLEHIAGEFSKEELWANLFSNKFRGVQYHLPALLGAIHDLLPAHNWQLALPYRRLRSHVGRTGGRAANK